TTALYHSSATFGCSTFGLSGSPGSLTARVHLSRQLPLEPFSSYMSIPRTQNNASSRLEATHFCRRSGEILAFRLCLYPRLSVRSVVTLKNLSRPHIS